MIRFYNSSAVINEQMVLVNADDDFYNYIGQDMYVSITQCIHPEDLNRFVEAMEALKTGKMSENIVSIRIKNGSGKYRWFLIEMSNEPFDIDGNALINLKLTDLAERENNSSDLKQLNEECDTYLSLMDSIMLYYELDTERFEIFTTGGGQRLCFFRGTLSLWKDEILNNNKIEEESVPAFMNLCKAMEEGRKSFSYEIVTNIFSQNKVMEICTFKCQTIRGAARSRKVLGCIGLYGRDRGNGIFLGMDSNKDAGIDVLNKKAITDYAKKAILSGWYNKIYIVILDLDDFKTINDNYGHMFGDEVLSTVAEIIKEAVGRRGMVGRIGGDELLIVFDKIEEHTELRNMLRRIRLNIEWAYKRKKKDFTVTCSIGAAAYPDNGATYEEVFRLADKMLYLAKEKGKNRYVIYIPEIHDPGAAVSQKKRNMDNVMEFQNDKIGVLYRLIELFLVKKIVTYETVLNEIGYAFGLDEIIISYEDMSIATIWNQEGVYSDSNIFGFLRDKEDFLNAFDRNNVYVVDGLHVVQGKYQYLYDNLTEWKVESAIFYKMVKNGNLLGVMMFAKKSQRQKWSEYEKTIIAVIGKIMEISFTDR